MSILYIINNLTFFCISQKVYIYHNPTPYTLIILSKGPTIDRE
jgi:hypothetical protein